MLACPNCQSRLVRERSGPELFWVCTACGGNAVRINVLGRAIDERIVDQVWAVASGGEAPRKRPCPLCSKLMAGVVTQRGRTPLPLDVCTDCKFVWFDPKEYEVLTEHIDRKEDRQPLMDQKWKWVPALLGMPVERETLPLAHRPWVTWVLAAVIVLISLVALSLPGTLWQLGLIPARFWHLGGLTFLTSFFLHGSLFHLLGNVYFLLVFGDNVEEYLGRTHYLLLLLGATLAGGLLHTALQPHSTVPVIGASGGISGVIVFYGLQFPRAHLLVLLRPLLFWPLKIRARTALLLWVLLQVVGAFMQIKGFSNVSALGHLGGAGVGLLFWLKWRSS